MIRSTSSAVFVLLFAQSALAEEGEVRLTPPSTDSGAANEGEPGDSGELTPPSSEEVTIAPPGSTEGETESDEELSAETRLSPPGGGVPSKEESEPSSQTIPAAIPTPSKSLPQCQPRPAPQVNEVPDVASFKTPVSPAFVALGLAPAEIQRPTTPTGLKAALASGFSGKDASRLMQNFAVEFSPYWLFPHHSLSYEQVQETSAWHLVRNLSVSLAAGPRSQERVSVASDGSETSEKADYGTGALGARTTIFPGWGSTGATECKAFLKSYLEEEALARSLAQEEFLLNWEAKYPKPSSPEENALEATGSEADYQENRQQRKEESAELVKWEKRRGAALARFRSQSLPEDPVKKARFDRCIVDIHAKTGFMAEVAGASSIELPEGKFQQRDQGGRTVNTGWLTLAYSFETLFGAQVETSILSAHRFQYEKGSPLDYDRSTRRFDNGLRLAFAAKRMGIAVEGTYRHQEDVRTGTVQKLYRVGTSLDYHLSSGMWLSGTFGKDFGDLEKEDPLIALANVQWNFGVERGIEVDRSATQ